MDNNSDIESDSESCGCFVFSLKNGERAFNLQLNEEYSIGSASDANIRLTSKYSVLDPTHSVVEVTEDGIATIIIKSTAQPLKVNGIKVEDFKVLKDDDVIEVIEKKFCYYTAYVTEKEIDKYAEDNFDMLKSKSIIIPESVKKVPSPQKLSTVKSRIPTRVPLTKSILKSRRKSESAFNRKISPVLTRKISTSVNKLSDKTRNRSSAKKSHTFASQSTTGAKKSLIGDLGHVENSAVPSRASKRKSSLATPIDLNESLQEDSLLKDDINVHISPLKKSPASTKKTPLSARKIAKNSPVSTRKSVRKSLSEKLFLKAADNSRGSNASSKKPSLLSDIDGISLLGSSLLTDDDDEVFATPAKFNTPASSKKSLLATLEESSDSNGRISAANTTDSTRRQSKRFIHLDSNKSVEENSESGTKKTPKSAKKSLNSLQKTPAGIGKTSPKRSSNVDLLLLAAADSPSKKSSASAKKSLIQENSPLIEGEISEATRKSQKSRLTVLDYEDYDPNDISTSASRKSRRSASLLEEAFKNNQFSTPENTPEADAKISRISSSKKSFNYGTPDSKWSNKTINSHVTDLEDSEVEAFRTRKSSSSKIMQEETPTTPENELHPFKTSTARKSSGQSRSLALRTPIDEHNYFKKRSQSLPNVDVEDGSLIEDLEEVFPTKQLRTKKSTPLVTNRVMKSHSLISLAQTPERTGNSLNSKLKDDSTFIELDIPSPIYLDKRRTTSILSKCQTPDKSGRLAKSMALSATKPGVRWSKSLVSIHTPDQSKMSSRSCKSTVQEDLDDLSLEEIDLAESLVSNHTPNQSKISRHSAQISSKLDFSPSTKIPTSVQTSASKSRKSVDNESLTNNETLTRLSVSLVKTPDQIGSHKFSTPETEIEASSSSRKSRSRKSTLDDETYLNNSEILSPNKTQTRTSLSRKSSANESAQHLLEENQNLFNSRMSSRSRKSTNIVNSSGFTLPDKMENSSSESCNLQENESILLSTSQEGSCLEDYPESTLSTYQTVTRDRMSSRSRASARVNENYTDKVDDLLSKSPRMSSRSRKSTKKDSDDSLRMSKSLSTVQPANDSRSPKCSVHDSSDLEVNTENDVSLSKKNQTLSQSRMSSRSRKSTASIVNSSSVTVSDKMENSSSESFNSQENESILLSTSQEGSCLEDYPESILSTSQTGARYRISSKLRASAGVNETYTDKVDDLLSKSQTQCQGRMSFRSRKSTKKDSDDSLRMSKSSTTVQTANDSRSGKSSVQDSSELEECTESDVSLSKKNQTLSQSRMSSRSRKSTALDQSDLNDSDVFSPNKAESRISKSLASVQNSNNSRISSRSRKSSVQDSSTLEANSESGVSFSKNIQTPSQTRISSRSRKSTALDESDLNDSDVFSPNKAESRISKSSASVQNSNNSRLSSRSRKSSVQDSSTLEANAESDVSLSKNIQTPPQTRISSRSRKSTTLDESDLNDLEVFSPNKAEGGKSNTSNDSRLSSRPRKSVVQENDVSLSKKIQTPSQTRISSRSRKSTAINESDLNDIDLSRKSKSFGSVQPSNDSRLSSRSLKSELQDSDTFEAYSENDITLSKIETPSQDRTSHRTRKSTAVDESDLRDSNDLSPNKTATRKSKSLSAVQPSNDSRRSSRFRRSTVQDSDTPKADITFSKIESQDGMSHRSRKSTTAVDEKDLNDSDVFSPNKAESRVSKPFPTVQPSTNSRLSSRSRISSVLDSSVPEAYAESDVSLSKKNQTLSQTRTSSRSRKSSTLDEIIDLNDSDAFSPNKTKSGKSTSLSLVQNSNNSGLSSKSSKAQDYSTFEANDSNVSLSKFQTPSQAGISYRSRKSAAVDETYNESNVDDFEDVPSPIQLNLRIANSVLSKTHSLDASRMSSKSPKFVAYETNLQDLDFPSPIPLEKRRTKSLNVQTSDNRRSSRGRLSVSEYSKTQIDDYTVTESSEYPLGTSRSKLSSDSEENEDEETIEEKSRNSKFVTKRMNRSLLKDSAVEDNIKVPSVSLRNSKKAASNLTFTRPTQDSSIISIDDSIENGNSESTPYQPITEDITPASAKKTSKLQNNVTVTGIKNLFAGSPKNDLTKVPNLRRLMSPKQQNSPRNRLSDFTGVQRLLKSPPNEPLNDLTKVPNLRRLMSPKEQKSPLNRLSDVYGVKNLLKTPRVVKKLTQKEPLNRLSDFTAAAQIFNASAHRLSTTSDIENNEELFSKIFNKKPLKTYRSHSLGMSPEKKDAYGATRKSVLDKPFLSPRVTDWAEEQAALRQKLVEKLEDPTFNLTAEPYTDVAVDEGTSLSSGKKRKLKNIEDDQKPVKKVKLQSTRPKKHVTEDNEEQTEHLSTGNEEIGESTELHPETEVDVSDNQECEDDNEITSQTIKKVKKKVTYVEEVTYYNISPVPGKTRRRKEDSVTEPKHVTAATEKKPAKSSKNKNFKLKNIDDFEDIQNLSSEKSEEVDEEPQKKKSQGRAMRSKKLDVLKEKESVSEEMKETKTTRATRGKKQMVAKEEEEKVDEQKEEVLVEAKAKKPTRTARGKKQIEAEKIEENVEESKEESKPTRTVRGNRGKKQIESEEVEDQKVEESKPKRTVRGKKQIESDKIEEVEKPKPTKGVRGKKQIEVEKKEEEMVEETKPARAVRGKKQIEAEKVEEQKVEESKPTRTARGKKQIETEKVEEQKVKDSKPTRTLRGKKQIETEVEELKPKKSAKSGRGTKKQTTVEKEEDDDDEPSSKSKRTKKDSVSEDLKEIKKSTRSAKSKNKKDRETVPSNSDDDILEVKPNRSKKGKIIETAINKPEDGVDETSSSKTTRKGGARAKKQKQVTNEDVEEKIVAKKPSKSNKIKNITKVVEENEEQNSEDDVTVKRGKPVKALPKRNKKESISEEQEPDTKAGKKKRDEKEESSNKRKKLEVAAEDTPTRTRSQMRALRK